MHMRYGSEPRLPWVAAICINRTDRHERSQQVQPMGDIYASAKIVLIPIRGDHTGDAKDMSS